MNYRITKFDPKKRNESGHYLDSSEWTSFSDMGRAEYNLPNYKAYNKTENAYVETVRCILNEKNISKLRIASLGLYSSEDDFRLFMAEGRLRDIEIDYRSEIASLKNGKLVGLSELAKLMRLILRETIWMKLNTEELEVLFGYDYYMYVTCEALSSQTIEKIEKSGLFVEPDTYQREIIVIDENGLEIY